MLFPKGYMPLAGDNEFILPYPNGLSFSDNSSCLAKFAEEYLIICAFMILYLICKTISF